MLEKELRANWDSVFYPEPEPEVETFGEEVQSVDEPVLLAAGPSGTVSDAGPKISVRTGRPITGPSMSDITEPARAMLDMGASTLKGTVQGFAGLPGDVEALAYGIKELFNRRADEGKIDAFLRGMSEQTIMPRTDEIRKWLDANVGTVAGGQSPYETIGEVVAPAGQIKAAKAAVKGAARGAKALAPKAGEMLDAYMQRSGMQANLMAYHGTPYNIDRFDPKKIGTGEGAQAYGYGLYFAESKDVAEGYRTTLAHKAFSSIVEKGRNNYDVVDPDGKLLASGVARGPAQKAKETFDAKQGSVYTVDIPDEMISRMIDWDKPLDKQPEVYERIKPLLDPMARAYGTGPLASKAGEQLQRLGREMGQEKLSERLRELGIPGIRYLDQGSRGTGEGTRNIVVFPGGENQIKIIKREGQGK